MDLREVQGTELKCVPFLGFLTGWMGEIDTTASAKAHPFWGSPSSLGPPLPPHCHTSA